MTLKQVIEALVFASPKPISTREIVVALRSAAVGSENGTVLELAKTKEDEVLSALGEMQEELLSSGRAFQLVERVNGWTLVSDPACAAWVRQLYPEAKPTRLTGPQLETLAIIAYRQPVTRADIEAVRGVAVDGVMQVLLDRGLVKIAGRAEVPGRPLLYSTTEYFLEHFGLKNTDELPNASELKRVPLPAAKVAEAAPTEATSEVPGSDAPPAEAAAPESTGEAAAAELPSAEGEFETDSTSEPSAEPEPEPIAEPEPVAEPEPGAEEAPAAEEEPAAGPPAETASAADQSAIHDPKSEIE